MYPHYASRRKIPRRISDGREHSPPGWPGMARAHSTTKTIPPDGIAAAWFHPTRARESLSRIAPAWAAQESDRGLSFPFRPLAPGGTSVPRRVSAVPRRGVAVPGVRRRDRLRWQTKRAGRAGPEDVISPRGRKVTFPSWRFSALRRSTSPDRDKGCLPSDQFGSSPPSPSGSTSRRTLWRRSPTAPFPCSGS